MEIIKGEGVKSDVKNSNTDAKLSNEELTKRLSQALSDNKKLLDDNKRMYDALVDKNEERVLRRLDYLLAVCNTKVFDDSPFQQKCAEEIKKILTLPSELAKSASK